MIVSQSRRPLTASSCSATAAREAASIFVTMRDLLGARELVELLVDEAVAGAELLVGGNAEADHVDVAQRVLHDRVEPLAEQGARAVHAGGVDEDELAVWVRARCRGWRDGWSAASTR